MRLSESAAATRRWLNERDDEYRTGWEEIMARAVAMTVLDTPDASDGPALKAAAAGSRT